MVTALGIISLIGAVIMILMTRGHASKTKITLLMVFAIGLAVFGGLSIAAFEELRSFDQAKENESYLRQQLETYKDAYKNERDPMLQQSIKLMVDDLQEKVDDLDRMYRIEGKMEFLSGRRIIRTILGISSA